LAIAHRVEELCAYAVEALEGVGVQVLSGRVANDRAGILIIAGDAQRLELMSGAGVDAALRGAGIRIGVHYYNAIEDIDRMVISLKG
jgi:selenocysteine lyase/cysteine desulfurase